MKDSDKQEFGLLLKATLEVYGVALSAAAISIWWAALIRFDLADIRAALAEHIQSGQGRFAPKPADVIGFLQAKDGHPGPDEAWAIVSQTLTDERVTVFWTSPMQAAFGVALNLQDDFVAARKAFQEVYSQELAKSRAAGRKPDWQMSPGTDARGRDHAIEEAVRLGRLPQASSYGLLSHRHDAQLPSGVVVKLLEG